MRTIKESIIGRKGFIPQKYELTNEILNWDRSTLHRIRALIDIPSKKVKKGDLGGWIESYDNLDQKRDCWVADNAWVYQDAKVYGDAQVYGDANVFGNAEVYGNANIFDNAEVYDDANVFDNAEVYGNAGVYGDARVYGKAWVCGTARVHGTAKVDYSINKGTVNK